MSMVTRQPMATLVRSNTMIETGSDMETACQSRAVIYSFLAEVFSSHPTPEAAIAVRQMAEALDLHPISDWAASDLEREYMDLFVVPTSRYAAPYESVYRDHWLMPTILKPGSDPGETSRVIKGLVMGESTIAVRQIYLEAGVVPNQGLPDHISNELYFLAHLCNCETENQSPVNSSFKEQRAVFCRDHLLKWIDQFREKVAQNERLGYYLTALRIIETLVATEVLEQPSF
jgi:TorA maturation chaperone TorD